LTPSALSPILTIVSYPGGKNGAGVYQTIINQIPPHRVYIEAFAGSGAVLRHKRPAQISYAIDRDPAVVAALTSTIGGVALTGSAPGDRGEAAERAPRDLNGGAAESCRRRSAKSPIQPATAALSPVTPDAVLLPRVRATLPMSDRLSALSPLGTPAAGSPLGTPAAGSPGMYLHGICADARAWLSGYKWKGDEFVYCDPPYLAEVRLQTRQVYRYEMMTEKEHTELLDVLRAIPCPVMVSGYWSAIYGRKLAAWRTVRFQAMTRGGKKMAECLWMNYPEPVELHDYRYLGETFRERQDFKRMRARWSKKLAEMPAVKRYAILAALGELNSSRAQS
jgi:D12 class N6 adenine-specific DNA methyltransferase